MIDLTDEEKKILVLMRHHRGKSNAIHGSDIVAKIHGDSWTVKSNGRLGTVMHGLRLKGYPIIGMRGRGGYFWIDTEEELREHISKMRAEIDTMQDLLVTTTRAFYSANKGDN